MRGLAAAVLALLLAAGPAAAQTSAFRPDPWLADLAQLRDALSAGYANLDWQVERGLDLPATYARAEQRLRSARDEYAARRAMERFVAAFADGHLEIRWPTPAAPAQPAATPGPPPGLCDQMGWFDAGDAGAIATRLPGFRRVGRPDANLPAGVVTSGGRKVGVLRVPVFTPQGLPRLCDALLRQEKLTPASPCDDACRQRLAGLADRAFVLETRDQLIALVAERPDVLLVDIADNGGGNDSPRALAPMLTARPLRKPAMAMVRGEPLARELASRQADVRAAIAAAPPAQQAALRRFDDALQRAQAEARVACDRGPLWRGEVVACRGVVREPLYDGPLPAPTAGATPDWVRVAEPAARFPAIGTLWRGPLVVLADWNAASSSELFAAMLQDGGAAVILGSRTFGAGCGHVTDAGPVTLANSGGVVSMPDCLRFRADGSNEAAGVQPDVAVGLRMYDSPKQRLDLVQKALPAALDLAVRRSRAGR